MEKIAVYIFCIISLLKIALKYFIFLDNVLIESYLPISIYIYLHVFIICHSKIILKRKAHFVCRQDGITHSTEELFPSQKYFEKCLLWLNSDLSS